MKTPKHWNCVDCRMNTAKRGVTEEFVRRKIKAGVAKAWFADTSWEVYEVKDAVWKAARCRNVLCIGCLEKRIGRRLTPADFTDGSLNQIIGSRRLSIRKGYRGTIKQGFVPGQSLLT